MKILRTMLIAGLALLPGAAMAAPNLLGPSGYFFTPDSVVLPRDCVNLGYHHFEVDEVARRQGLRRVTFTAPDVNAYKLNYGLFDRLEVGLAYVDHNLDGDQTLLNAKYAILQEKEPQDADLELVVGIMDATDSFSQTPYIYASTQVGDDLQRFPVISRALPRRIRAGVGLGAGIVKGVFVNAGIPLTPNIELIYEGLNNGFLGYDGWQNNLGGRIRTNKVKGLALDIGAINFDHMVLGISYSRCFGKRKKHHDDERPGRDSPLGPDMAPPPAPGPVAPPPPPPGGAPVLPPPGSSGLPPAGSPGVGLPPAPAAGPILPDGRIPIPTGGSRVPPVSPGTQPGPGVLPRSGGR